MVLQNLLKRLKPNKSNKPKERKMYAITQGEFKGEFFVYMENCTISDKYEFLSLPLNVIRSVSEEDWSFAIENKIIKPLDNLPRKVYNICFKQYEYEKSNTGREQHSLQDVVRDEELSAAKH